MTPDEAPTNEITIDARQVSNEIEERRTLFQIEGGEVSIGTFHGRPCLLTDEGTLADSLDNELDRKIPLVRIRLFEGEEHRRRYIEDRGWLKTRHHWRSHRLALLRDQIVASAESGVLDRSEFEALVALLDEFAKEPFDAANPLLPHRLEYHEVTMGGSTDVTFRAGTIYSEQFGVSPSDAADDRRLGMFSPTDASWKAFWRGIDKLGAWNWGEDDTGQDTIYDGAQWSFYLARDGKAFHLGGEGETANERFQRLVPLLRRLLNGWPL